MRMPAGRRCFVLVGLAVVGIAAAGPDLRLVDAAKNAEWEALPVLLKQGADPNASQADGTTALHWAAYWDHGESADLLIRAGARVNTANDLSVTPLWAACENGSAGMVRRLLQAGANPNAALISGETPLMTAARTGNPDVVKQLLAEGADVSAKEHSEGQTALMWAVSQLQPAVVEVLLEHGADVHAQTKTWTQVVLTTGEYFNSRYVRDIQQGGYTPLLFAARVGDLASAKLLLAAGADVNDTAPYGTSALVVAAHSGHGDLAAFLLMKGADPNTAGAGYTALHAAILRKDERLVSALLAHGADPNAPLLSSTPMRRASYDYHLSPSFVGATPFWLAARFTAPNIMRLLADRGADPRFVHHLAFWKTKLMEPAWVVEGDTTAVMAAVGMGDRLYRGRIEESLLGEGEAVTLEAVRVATDLGVDVNVANAEGDTALHTAATRGFDSVVEFLVEKGARLDVKNKKGQTPLASAMGGSSRVRADGAGSYRGNESTRKSTVELLRKLGAKE